MVNYFEGFRDFTELAPLPQPQQPQQQKAPGYLDTIKKQQRVPKKLWLGMPVPIGANHPVKLGGRLFKGPVTLYVTEFDDATVTVKLVKNPMDFSNADDPDDEIDFTNPDDDGDQTFVIPRSVFEKLLEPDNFPGVDYATPSQTIFTPR